MSEPAWARKVFVVEERFEQLGLPLAVAPDGQGSVDQEVITLGDEILMGVRGRLVGELRVGVADGVADVGDDFQRVGVAQLGTVTLC